MDQFNGIFDLFKYNIILQKYNEKDYNALFLIGCLFLIISFYNNYSFSYKNLYLTFLKLYYNNFYSIAVLTLEGQHITKHTSFSVKVKTLMSDNFKAMWVHIDKYKNNNIFNLLECFNEFDDGGYDDNENNKEESIFIVDQVIPFEIKKHIYCIVNITQNNDDECKNPNNNIKLECKYISLQVFSYIYDVHYLKNFVEEIKDNYLKSIEDRRKNLNFYYKLKDICSSENTINWYEKEFKTNKSFDNLYLKNKEDVINKINFFLNNEQWYKDQGHPYTLGIGLYGPPGTGKTSFIKCLAKKTNRHIIEISLSKIKSENELYDVYYDTKYHKYNKEPLDFRKKIIILEDIDCSNDIVLKREFKKNNSVEISDIVNVLNIDDDDDDDQDVNKKRDKYKKNSSVLTSKTDFTLSSLLNILDGISEDHGRILIMTSNCWNKLDPALIRPGRIDIEIELSNINNEILEDYVFKYYRKKIPIKRMNNINIDYITPCIMINEHSNSKNFNDFLNRLEKY